MKRKIFVTGSGGMVGYYLERVFDDFDLTLTDLNTGYLKLDIRDAKETNDFIISVKPDIVLHLAAATDVDKCENDKDWAYECNREGTRNVAMACKDCNAIMVYISSGSVFSGKLNRPARETDIPDPVNVYGVSKLSGEEEIRSILKQFFIVRAGWMMGGGPLKDKKFIGKIMRKIILGELNLRIIEDRFGSPVYAKDLLEGIKKLLSTAKFGTYHMVNEQTQGCSRYEITKAIKEILKKEELDIEAVSSGEFNLAAPRSNSEQLENYNLRQIQLDCMRPWKEALAEYIRQDWGL